MTAWPWWRARTRREQKLLALLGTLLLLGIVWLAAVRPIAALRNAAAARHDIAAADLAAVRRMGAAMPALQARATAARSLPIVERIDERARSAGLTVQRLEAAGDCQALLEIAAVRPAALLAWLAAIETRDGLIIESLAITRNDDESVAVRITFRSPA